MLYSASPVVVVVVVVLLLLVNVVLVVVVVVVVEAKRTATKSSSRWVGAALGNLSDTSLEGRRNLRRTEHVAPSPSRSTSGRGIVDGVL